MKRIFLLMLSVLSLSVMAQDNKTADDYVAEGSDAYRSKDYKSAFTAFETALQMKKQAGVTDTVLYYNTGYCAYKSNQFEKASTYFEKSVELGYKTELSYVFATNSYRKANNDEKFATSLTAAFEKYPKNKTLVMLMATHQFKLGLNHYNKASEIVAEAAKINETEPDRFKTLMSQAQGEYNLALPYLLKTYDLNPKTKNLFEALSGVYEGLNNKEEAVKWKALAEK